VLLAELLAQGRLHSREKRSRRASSRSRTDIMTRRTLDGAPKCAFRDLRRELDTEVLIFVMAEASLWCCRCRGRPRLRNCVCVLANGGYSLRLRRSGWAPDQRFSALRPPPSISSGRPCCSSRVTRCGRSRTRTNELRQRRC
jgi:hypothetical protein